MFTENFNKLKHVANYFGYSVNIVPDRFVSSCGHLTKHINISKKGGEIKSIFEFAHELGHCKQFIIVWDKLKGNKEEVKQLYRERDRKKYKFMLNEFEAWLLGYYLLKENEINTHGYWQHAYNCLKSHLLKTKPNSVKGSEKMKKYIVQWGKYEMGFFDVKKAVSFAEKTGLDTGSNAYVWVEIDDVRDREPFFKAEWEV